MSTRYRGSSRRSPTSSRPTRQRGVSKMAFPRQRLRRTRRTAGLRNLVRETRLSVRDFVYPIFVTAGEDVKNPIASMPGIFQLSINHAVAEALRAHELGIPAVL